jgi:hypothetical protein
MKQIVKHIFCMVLLFNLVLTSYGQDKEKAPRLYTDRFKTLMKDGQLIDSSKHDLGVVVRFSKSMKKYDKLSVKLYQAYAEKPKVIANDDFYPERKDFQLKYDSQDSLKLYFIDPTKPQSGYSNDEVLRVDNVNAHLCKWGVFPGDNDFYFTVIGYIKTGEHATYAEDGSRARMVNDYDRGTELTEQSIHFKSFERQAKIDDKKETQKKNPIKGLFGK